MGVQLVVEVVEKVGEQVGVQLVVEVVEKVKVEVEVAAQVEWDLLLVSACNVLT